MIIGAAILQGTLSVKNALNDQYFKQLAREAAEAGVRQAESCVSQAMTWSQLRPNSTCTGAINGSAPNYVFETDTYRTTFTVGMLDVRSDGSTLVTARGQTELLRRESGAAYKTYQETVGKAVGASSMSVLPAEMATTGVAFDDAMSYILGYDGQVYGMGSNGNGRLGDGTTTSRDTPVKFNLPAGLYAKKVEAAYHFAAVIASNGQVYMAGNNVSGQLGDGTTTARSTPVRFQLPAGVFAVDVEVTGGSSGCSCGYNTYVLASNGRVYGAGNNEFGQLTGTNTANQLTPKVLPLPSGVTRVRKMATTNATNNNNSLIILGNNGNVYGTGENSYYQLGNSTGTPKTSFIQLALPGGIGAIDIYVGYYNTYVLTEAGDIYGFGKGYTGQFGSGSTTTRQSTAQFFDMPGTLKVQKFVTSSSSEVDDTDNNDQNTAYVLATDHQVYGSGQNHKGQLSDGSTTNRAWPVKFQLPAGLMALDVSTHYYTTCVLASDKQVYCSGENKYGQLGLGNLTNQTTAKKFPLPSGVSAVNVMVSRAQVYVTASDGNIYAAGRNADGELGTDNTIDQDTPVTVKRPTVPLERVAKQASLTFQGTRVLASDGQVYSVGANSYGEFGNAATADPQTIPVRFQLPAGYARSVKGGINNTFVLSSDGNLYGAGRNRYNQLAYNSDPTDRSTPVKYGLVATAMRDFQPSTSDGNDTTMVFAADNYVYGTGLNGQGQLGNGNTAMNPTPFSTGRFGLPAGLRGMKFWFGDGGSNNASFVLATDERVYAAGRNNYGQLGLGNNTNPIITPDTVNFPAGCYADHMDVGTDASFEICRNGDVYAMGRNTNGQLGDGTTTNRNVPTKVLLPAGVTGIKLIIPRGSTQNGGYAHVLASDGNVYGWGANSFGQLGDATTTQRPTPVRFQLPAGITAVDAWPGSYSIFVLGSDGNIYASGANFSGQLGVGDTVQRTTPTKVLLPSGVVGVSVSAQYAYYSQSTAGTPDHFTSFLGSDGKLYMAGYNGHGQLGDGTTSQRNTPVEFILPQPAPKADIIF